jgi:hypothetical protein
MTSFSNASPVRPSWSVILDWLADLPPQLVFYLLVGCGLEHRRGVPLVEFTAAQPSSVSRIWPRFIRLGTPSGFRQISERRAVSHVGHILFSENAGDDTLVAVAAGHLVAFLELALGGDKHLDNFIHARRKIVALAALQALNVDHGSLYPVRHTKRGVADFLGLLTEDGIQELELRSGFGLALRRDLSHEDVAASDLRANTDDSLFVELIERLLAGVRDVSGDLLRSELGLADIDCELLDVDAGEDVFLDYLLEIRMASS